MTPNPSLPYPDPAERIIPSPTPPFPGDFGDFHGDFGDFGDFGGDFGDFGYSGDPSNHWISTFDSIYGENLESYDNRGIQLHVIIRTLLFYFTIVFV